MELGTVVEEAALCRAAFAGSSVGDWVLHCHHRVLVEQLTVPAENRIAYILAYKTNPALRLRLFRPLGKKFIEAEEFHAACVKRDLALAEWSKDGLAAWDKARIHWDLAFGDWDTTSHLAACVPECPWNGNHFLRYPLHTLKRKLSVVMA